MKMSLVGLRRGFMSQRSVQIPNNSIQIAEIIKEKDDLQLMNEKMNPDEEISKATNNDLNEESSNEINSSVNDFSCFHVLISFIINLGLLIIAIIEFVIKKDCLIFNYLVDICYNYL